MAKNWLGEMVNLYNHPSVILWRAIELKTVTEALKKEKIKLDRPILDLGCGEGKVAGTLFGKGAVDYGLDNCSGTAELAEKSGVYKKVILGDACQLPFKDQTLKTVFSNCVIEHIQDIDKVLSEVSRVLRRNGSFVFTVPSSNFSQNLSFYKIFSFLGLKTLAEGYSHFRNSRLNHYNCFNLREWEKRLEVNGLRTEYHKFYITPGTLFLWDFCALMVFPLTLLNKILKFKKISFPFGNTILETIFGKFYREDVHNSEGTALLLVARKT